MPVWSEYLGVSSAAVQTGQEAACEDGRKSKAPWSARVFPVGAQGIGKNVPSCLDRLTSGHHLKLLRVPPRARRP